MAANLVALLAENEKLKASYFRDQKNGNLSEQRLQYPPRSKVDDTSHGM